MQYLQRSLIAVSGLALILFAAACKEGDPIQGTIAPATASFDEDSVPAGVTDHFVTLKNSSANGSRIQLDVMVNQIPDPAIAVTLELSYPDEFSKFISCTPGPFLSQGGLYQCTENAPGVVVVGREGDATRCNGSQMVIRLEFLVYGAGAGRIGVEKQNVGGGSAVADENNIPFNVQWVSGVLRGS